MILSENSRFSSPYPFRAEFPPKRSFRISRHRFSKGQDPIDPLIFHN